MGDSKTTRAAMAAAFKKLVIENSFEKVSIYEICDLCGMNRKSFYYHFHDKYELVVWIFENEFLKKVSEYPPENIWDSISSLCEYFYNNKSFYKKILKIDGQNCFGEYFHELCKKTFAEKMRARLKGITVTDHNVKLYAGFFVYSIYCWIAGHDTRTDREFVRDLKNSVLFGAELANMFSHRPDRQISDEEKELFSMV